MKLAVGTAGSEAPPLPLSLAATEQSFKYLSLDWLAETRGYGAHGYGHPRVGGSGRSTRPGPARPGLVAAGLVKERGGGCGSFPPALRPHTSASSLPFSSAASPPGPPHHLPQRSLGGMAPGGDEPEP